MIIIPALDILDGNLVRLEKGNFNSSKIYSANPFEAAEEFSRYNFNLLHIVDLSGSRDGKILLYDLITKIVSNLKVKIQFGGGIRKLQDAQQLFNCGVDKLVIGSMSVSDKSEFEKIISNYGAESVICAIDSQNKNLKIKGWTEGTDISIYDHISYCSGLGINTFLCTDIERDGMLNGPNYNLYKSFSEHFPEINIIASGGVSSIEDIEKLNSLQIYGVITGKAIYENKISLKELAEIAR